MSARITVPGLAEPEAIEALQAELSAYAEHAEHLKAEQGGMVAAMLRLRKPIARRTRRKARKTSHVRHMARVAVRSSYLKEISA